MPDNWFVVIMGIGTVFAVLVLIIGLCWLVGLLFHPRKEETTTQAALAPTTAPTAIANRAELAAAIAVAVAEYSGTDASAIRILSIKKI